MDLSNYISDEELIVKRKQFKKIFFYRICGSGMGATACLLRELGYHVEGVDFSYAPPMSTYLEQEKIPCHSMDLLKPDFLKQFDLVVVGNSVAKNSEHAQSIIEKSGVPFTSFPSVLGAFALKDCNVIGIAGTHGKTTTTYLMMQLLENLKQNPGYLIGGILDNRPPAGKGGKNDKHEKAYFVIESDEYDSAYFQKFSKFRLYQLNNIILTSLEFDHADIFRNVKEIENQFAAVLPEINGHIIVNDDYPSIKKLHARFKNNTQWVYYGLNSPIGPFEINTDACGSNFKLKLGSQIVVFETSLKGVHNILNLSGCLIFAYQEGFEIENLQNAARELELVKRRQEVRGTYKGAIVIDDFAHHPKAVRHTLETIRLSYPDKKIHVVMDPISATARSSVFQEEFKESLKGANSFALAKPNIATTALAYGDLNGEKLVKDVEKTYGIKTMLATEQKQLLGYLDEMCDEKSVLLIMSNRTCLGLWEADSEFVKELKAC
ncbi:MAG: Mur ligase family protein [Bacteriovoracia bacterium]